MSTGVEGKPMRGTKAGTVRTRSGVVLETQTSGHACCDGVHVLQCTREFHTDGIVASVTKARASVKREHRTNNDSLTSGTTAGGTSPKLAVHVP